MNRVRSTIIWLTASGPSCEGSYPKGFVFLLGVFRGVVHGDDERSL